MIWGRSVAADTQEKFLTLELTSQEIQVLRMQGLVTSSMLQSHTLDLAQIQDLWEHILSTPIPNNTLQSPPTTIMIGVQWPLWQHKVGRNLYLAVINNRLKHIPFTLRAQIISQYRRKAKRHVKPSPDMRITRGLYTSVITPLSEEGRRWVNANMYRHGFELAITIQTEEVDDLREEIEKDNLRVE